MSRKRDDKRKRCQGKGMSRDSEMPGERVDGRKRCQEIRDSGAKGKICGEREMSGKRDVKRI
jgi:hypothetical protein